MKIGSANNLIHSAELYFITASPKYGKLDVLSDKLSYKGTKPELGEVKIDKQGKSRIYAYIDGYCVTKEYSGEVYASKTSKDSCNWYGIDNYETKEGTTFDGVSMILGMPAWLYDNMDATANAVAGIPAYWTSTPYKSNDTNAWGVGAYANLSNYTSVSAYGIRPVIIISKSDLS